MKQQLTRYGFIELFTDDDMNVSTMKGLLQSIYTQHKSEYNYEEGVFAHAARTSVRSACCAAILHSLM
jgi:uncharacterized protein YqgQ